MHTAQPNVVAPPPLSHRRDGGRGDRPSRDPANRRFVCAVFRRRRRRKGGQTWYYILRRCNYLGQKRRNDAAGTGRREPGLLKKKKIKSTVQCCEDPIHHSPPARGCQEKKSQKQMLCGERVRLRGCGRLHVSSRHMANWSAICVTPGTGQADRQSMDELLRTYLDNK